MTTDIKVIMDDREEIYIDHTMDTENLITEIEREVEATLLTCDHHAGQVNQEDRSVIIPLLRHLCVADTDLDLHHYLLPPIDRHHRTESDRTIRRLHITHPTARAVAHLIVEDRIVPAQP